MIDDELAARVMRLYQVENLSMHQISAHCCMCTKTFKTLSSVFCCGLTT